MRMLTIQFELIKLVYFFGIKYLPSSRLKQHRNVDIIGVKVVLHNCTLLVFSGRYATSKLNFFITALKLGVSAKRLHQQMDTGEPSFATSDFPPPPQGCALALTLAPRPLPNIKLKS